MICTAAKITARLRMRRRHPRGKPARAGELGSVNNLQSKFPLIRANIQSFAFFYARVAGHYQVIGFAFPDDAGAAPFEENHNEVFQIGQILDGLSILDDGFPASINDKRDEFRRNLEKSRHGNERASRVRLTYAM
jgi:hypothetical protein